MVSFGAEWAPGGIGQRDHNPVESTLERGKGFRRTPGLTERTCIHTDVEGLDERIGTPMHRMHMDLVDLLVVDVRRNPVNVVVSGFGTGTANTPFWCSTIRP